MTQLRDNNGNRLDYITVAGHTSDRDGYNTVYAKVGSDVVRITLDEPFFDVFNIDIPNEVVEGDSFTVSADIDNSDGRQFEQTIEYSVDGTVEDSTIEELENESQNVSFSDVIYSPGSYTLEVSSDDASMSDVLDVLEEAYFSVYGISAPSTVEEDESFSVSATVENTGEASDTQDISYNRGGSSSESLSGGESTGVSFSDSISDEGSYTLTISSDDDSDSTSITVEAAIPDNVVAYGGDDANTYVHDVSDGSLMHTLTESADTVEAVGLSDTHVAYGESFGGNENTYVHDLSDGSLVHTLTESGGAVRGVALSDTYVAYGGRDENTYVHDVSDGSLVHTLTASGGIVVSVSLSESYVAYGGGDDNTYVHDLSDGSLVHTLTESGDTVRDVALSDSYVAYGSNDNNAYVHDLSDGSLVQTLTEAEFTVRSVALSDTHIAYGSNDENTYIHNVSNWSLVQTLTESGDAVVGVALS